MTDKEEPAGPVEPQDADSAPAEELPPLSEAATETTPVTETLAAPPRVGRDWVVIGLVIALVVNVVLVPVRGFSLFGLPAHILIEHIPVVLVPLVCLAAAIIVWHGEWRRRYGLALAITALAASLATILTAGTGKTLQADLFGRAVRRSGALLLGREQDLVHRHAQAGEHLRLVMFVLAAVIVAVVVIDRLRARSPEHPLFSSRILDGAVPTAITLLAALTLGLVVYTGHLGAQAVWSDRAGNGRFPANGAAPGFRGGPFVGPRQFPFNPDGPGPNRRFRFNGPTTTTTTAAPNGTGT